MYLISDETNRIGGAWSTGIGKKAARGWWVSFSQLDVGRDGEETLRDRRDASLSQFGTLVGILPDEKPSFSYIRGFVSLESIHPPLRFRVLALLAFSGPDRVYRLNSSTCGSKRMPAQYFCLAFLRPWKIHLGLFARQLNDVCRWLCNYTVNTPIGLFFLSFFLFPLFSSFSLFFIIRV